MVFDTRLAWMTYFKVPASFQTNAARVLGDDTCRLGYVVIAERTVFLAGFVLIVEIRSRETASASQKHSEVD